MKTIRNKLIYAVALSLLALPADAQDSSLFGIWRGQAMMPGAGGLDVIISIEQIFRPDGHFSSVTQSNYANGPTAGRLIGKLQEQGTYQADPNQGVLSLHVMKHTGSDKTTQPTDEYDHYHFTSPDRFIMQSLDGGPLIAFVRAQQ
ncbi:MAG TPA: hypothetical protein PK231_01265 [Acidocella sp.]|nr:MAG: hypothetical protein B7Z77_01410 [Acidocella sp. 20-58-15]HQT38021.1 hypothetical protein [Acidocella sp.]